MSLKYDPVVRGKHLVSVHVPKLFKALGLKKIPIRVHTRYCPDNTLGEFNYDVLLDKNKAVRLKIDFWPKEHDAYTAREFDLNYLDTIAHEVYHYYQHCNNILELPGPDSGQWLHIDGTYLCDPDSEVELAAAEFAAAYSMVIIEKKRA